MSYRDLKFLSLQNNIVVFEIAKFSEYTTGTNNLIQRIIKMLLTQKGTSIIDPNYGTSFYEFFKPVTSDDASELKNLVPLIITDLLTQLFAIQNNEIIKGIAIPDNEFLLDIKLKNIIYDTETISWYIQLEIETKQGLSVLVAS